uniref:Cell growth-regulating nucleolar protein n=1 Tax=Gasterosteus aculeatus TaxID=69293 RepID=G3P3C5_GASAC|nr:cell growth-regulating nucleolar protein [Gasterosteus aculeatus aculeatus]
MVFFTCNACGESLKKAQVDKHVGMCRGCQVLSCIDCGKDFCGDDYKNHTRCISENQKYGGKGFEAKANKGDVKQQQWIQRVHDAMNKPGVSTKLKGVLQQISSYENVPKKKAKFQNWMKSCLNIANSSLHDEVWDLLTAVDLSPEAPQETKAAEETVAEVRVDSNGNEKQNGHQDGGKKKLNKRERKAARQQKNGKAVKGADKTVAEEPEGKKKKDRKRKHSSEEDEEQNGADNETSSKKSKTIDEEAAETSETEDQKVPRGKFNWKGNIKAVLRESADQELPVKKL